jgi:hypothetical protein
LNPQERRAACVAGEPQLGQHFVNLRPPVAVVVVRSIRQNVRRAAAGVGWTGQILELPYPGRWSHHRDVFIAQLLPVLSSRDERAPTSQPSLSEQQLSATCRCSPR